jgi:hypothetical protein
MLLLSHELGIPGVRCLAPGELRAHLEERFAWALDRGHAVGALACELCGLEAVERRSPGITPRVLGNLALALETAFRAPEVVVHRHEGCLAVLLVGLDPVRMDAACREWVAGAKELSIDGVGPLRLSPRIGYAVTQPGKRMFLDTLIQVAREGLRVARCRGPGACVHTMLYDLVQGRLEGERGTEGIVVNAIPPSASSAPASEPSRSEPGSETGTRATQVLLTDPRRDRELTEALDAERRENDVLRARLRDLESLDPRSDRIDTLERRLAKLKLSLVEAEERLASQATAVDSGIATRHRTVQGLGDADPHRAALLEELLAANLELRERLRSELREAA